MTVVLASNPAAAEAPLPAIDVRALSKRLAVPAAMAALVLAAVLLGGGRVHAFVEGLRRGLGVSPGWAALGVALEVVSLAGYVALLSLVAGRATARIGVRESAQITLAGAAATRVLPTAGVGGLGLTHKGRHSHPAGVSRASVRGVPFLGGGLRDAACARFGGQQGTC